MLIAAAIAVASLVLTDRDSIMLRDRLVRIGDVARADAAIAGTVIARLPAGRGGVSLSRRAIAALIRRAVPGVVISGGERAGDVALTMPPALPKDGASTSNCHVARHAIRAGETVTADLIERGRCGSVRGLLMFDAERQKVLARRAIGRGTPLGRLRLPEAPAVRKGDALALVARIGPVTIERNVTAMQAGTGGRALFVRSGDGQVFAARLSGAGR
ncbi:flagella basal body P-ring formation protein FlgA [Sphingomonas sp. DT-204]|uniref:flagella basal body P-ring formation protein FlgA n=1 Tax=Sphingomonas sp. DT-204 TaxID=3396166 RepID=UPI003F1AEC81